LKNILEPYDENDEVYVQMTHSELKFVNREKECETIIRQILANVDCTSLSQKALIGFGQSYGAGKTSIGLNLISAAKHNSFFQNFKPTTESQSEAIRKLENSIIVLVDLRTFELESTVPLKNQLFQKFKLKLKEIVYKIKDTANINSINNILAKLDSLKEKGMEQFCTEVLDECNNNPNLSFLFFVDEIDAINSQNNITICPEGLNSTDPYERLYCLWTILSIFLEKNIFLLVAGKSSSLSMIGKELINIKGHSRSPTKFFHITLPHLEKQHYEISIKNTKITVTHSFEKKSMNNYCLTANDVLYYRLNFEQDLVNEFMDQAYIHSKGIPRILFNITQAFLETKRKIETKKELITFIEEDCLNAQKLTDIAVDFDDKWYKDCYLRLLLFAALEIPISINMKFKVPDPYNFKTIPVLELIANMSIFHESYRDENATNDDLVKLVIPKYTLLLLKKRSIKEYSQTPSFLLSDDLLSRREIIEKGELLQELTLQCIIAHFIAENANVLFSNTLPKTYKEIFESIFKNCFFRDQYVKANVTNDGYYIRNIPGFSNKRQKELTDEELSDFKINPWAHLLNPCWESMNYILTSPMFNISNGIFLRPSPKSIGGDIYFVLPHQKLCKFIIFQFKYYQEDANGYGDFSWSLIQKEINNVSYLLPNGESNNTINNAFANDDVHICLVFVAFGLSKEVCLVLQSHLKSTGEKSLLLSSGNWMVKTHNNSFIITQSSDQTALLSIPNNMEILFISKEGMKCLLGDSNYDLLEKYKNDFKLNSLANRADSLFEVFGYTASNFDASEDSERASKKRRTSYAGLGQPITNSNNETHAIYGIQTEFGRRQQPVAITSYASHSTLGTSTAGGSGQQMATSLNQEPFDLAAWIAGKLGLNIERENHKKRLDEIVNAFEEAGALTYELVNALDEGDLEEIDRFIGEKKLTRLEKKAFLINKH